MDKGVAALDRDDLQGLIGRGYAELKAASYVLLEIDDASRARTWLATVQAHITSAAVHPPDVALNVAFSVTGLQKLGVPHDTINQFSNEFRTGMTTPHRQRSLGDIGPSAPEHWLWGGPLTPAPDVLVLLFGRDSTTLEARLAAWLGSAAQGAVTPIVRLDAFTDLNGKEHFGFADGISQPTIEGLSSRVDTPANTVKAGEFVLGYENEYGLVTDAPELARNGSYVVFRQLSQDVRGFWRFVDRASGGTDRRTWLAAKMVGRWPSGAPLTLAPDVDDPRLASANDFTYQYGDADGLNCPIGAHVRRSHPRDSLDPSPGTVQSVALDKRHRLLRRGREYGPPVGDPLAAAPSGEDAERGLYFICVAGNIARQFEFIQHTWLNNPKFDGLYDETDPLIGQRAQGDVFSLPATPVRRRVAGLPQFVTTRGGGYFFLPSLRALKSLVNEVLPDGA